MNIKYIEEEAKFYFICEECGEIIENLDGVVDFPMSFSKNLKAPLRFYHRGDCAYEGNKQRANDHWGCWSLKDFVKNLTTGELPEMVKLMLDIK